MHLVIGTGNSPSLGRPTPGVVKQDKSSGGSVDTTETCSGPQRVRMSSGERPIGAAEGKQSDTEALCHPPPPPRTRAHGLRVCTWMHLVNGTGNSPSPGQPTPGVVKQDKSSGGSVDTTETCSGPQRVRMSSGERPMGAAGGKQSDTEALCHPPPPPHPCAWTQSVHLDAPGQRHGQQPVSGTADPRSSQTGQVIRGLR